MRKLLSRGLAAAWIAAGTALYGQDPEPAILVHDFQHDPVEVWLSAFLKIILAMGIPILLYSMIRYRGRLAGRLSWALAITGVVILPMLCVSFGSLLVFEKAVSVEFCASCHLTMQVYVDDMVDPQSESLAAVHYKNRYIPSNQCYDCHTGYGMFGTVEAKMSGMIDVYKYYTKTYEFPIQMRSPYSNGDCLKCHSQSQKWLSQELHLENRAELFSDGMACLDCHGPMGHPAHSLEEAD